MEVRISSDHPDRPRRLARVFSPSPLYFVTVCTLNRRRILDCAAVRGALEAFARRNAERGVAVGRYVIMPDHVHIFIRLADGFHLGQTIRLLKVGLSAALRTDGCLGSHWQPGFFDHVMRSDESYALKWEYVRLNPVRAGLVRQVEEWPFQGEPTAIDRA